MNYFFYGYTLHSTHYTALHRIEDLVLASMGTIRVRAQGEYTKRERERVKEREKKCERK